jgi:soluble cytochrome b562
MKQMQEAMKRPEVQQQMQEMQQAMANPELQKRVAALRDDPEFKDMFEDIQKGGMGALMKYMNDPTLTARLGAKLGDVPDAPPAPEVNDLIDAARCGTNCLLTPGGKT